MQNTRFLLLLLITMGFSFSASAQLSLGVRSGVYWANIRQTDLIDELAPEFDDIRSFQGAIVGEYAVSDVFAVQTEVGVTRKGFGYLQGVDVDLFNVPLPLGVRAEARFDYLDLPVLAKLKFGGEQFKGYVLAGPQVGYALDGKLVTRADGLFDFQISKTDINLDAVNYERFEVAGTMGAGASFDAGFGTFFVDARYTHGFTQLYDIPLVNETIRNRGFGVSAGFTVPLGGGRTPRP